MIAYWLASHLYPLSLSSCAYFGGYGGMARWQDLIWERLVVNWISYKSFLCSGTESMLPGKMLYFFCRSMDSCSLWLSPVNMTMWL